MSDATDSQPDSASSRPRPLAMPGAKEKRRISLALVGFIIVVVTGFGFWFVLQSANTRGSYVATNRTIQRWDVLSASDLQIVEANVGEASAITPDQASSVLGRWATGTIPAGTLITPGMFQLQPLSNPEEAGSIILEVSLPADEAPFGTLETGDTVALIGRESAGGGGFENVDQVLGPPTLIGLLRLELKRGENFFWILPPTQALVIKRTIERYLDSSERFIWKLGADLTAQDVRDALGG